MASRASRTTRREFLTLAGTSAAALLAASRADLVAPFGASPAAAQEFKGTREIAVGVMAPSHCAAPYVYAEVRELFKKHGLKPTLVYYQNMADIAGDLVAGKLQYGQLILPLFLAVHLKAGPFKDKGVPLVSTQATGTNGGAITVRADSGLETIGDLAGRKVGSHSMLTTHYLLLASFIRKNEIKLKAPIKMEILALEEILPGLEKGSIDAFIMPEPTNAVAAVKGFGKVIFLTNRLWQGHPCCILSTTKAFAEGNPGTVAAMSAALAEACLFANDAGNRAAFIDVVQQNEHYRKVPRPILEKALTPGRADFAPYLHRSSARVVADMMKSLKIVPEAVTPEKIVEGIDAGPLRQALKALGGDTAFPDYRLERVLGEELKFS